MATRFNCFYSYVMLCRIFEICTPFFVSFLACVRSVDIALLDYNSDFSSNDVRFSTVHLALSFCTTQDKKLLIKVSHSSSRSTCVGI